METTLTKEIMNQNKERFISLLQKAGELEPKKKPGIDRLINWLEGTDFYYAPASTKYHGNYEGGLCEHSIKVYDNLCTLNTAFNEDMKEYDIIICALLHDLCKIDFYKKVVKGAYKKDENGATIQPKVWEEKEVYDYGEEKTILGHSPKSIFIIQHFFLLSDEQAEAIYAHMGGMECSDQMEKNTYSKIYNKNKLAFYLHLADYKQAYYG